MNTTICGAWMRDIRDSGEHYCNLPFEHTGPHEEADGTPHSVKWETSDKAAFECCEGVFVHSYDCAERDPGGSAAGGPGGVSGG